MSREGAPWDGYEATEEAKLWVSVRGLWLGPLLRDLGREVALRFPRETVSLRLVRCPEGGPDRLWAFIETERPLDDARSRFDGLVEDWWLDNLRRAGGDLHLGVEFV